MNCPEKLRVTRCESKTDSVLETESVWLASATFHLSSGVPRGHEQLPCEEVRLERITR